MTQDRVLFAYQHVKAKQEAEGVDGILGLRYNIGQLVKLQ